MEERWQHEQGPGAGGDVVKRKLEASKGEEHAQQL